MVNKVEKLVLRNCQRDLDKVMERGRQFLRADNPKDGIQEMLTGIFNVMKDLKILQDDEE